MKSTSLFHLIEPSADVCYSCIRLAHQLTKLTSILPSSQDWPKIPFPGSPLIPPFHLCRRHFQNSKLNSGKPIQTHSSCSITRSPRSMLSSRVICVNLRMRYVTAPSHTVDAQCVHSSSPLLEPLQPRDSPDSEFTVLVCSDAPDFYEGDSEPRLKTLRLPIATAFHYLDAIDQLTITPSEIYTLVFEDQYTNILRMRPLPCLTPIPPYTDDLDEQLYKLGSFAEMRERKKQGLRLGEQPLGALGSL